MASVGVRMPESLDHVEDAVLRATAAALIGAGEETLTAVKTDPALPVVTGGARRALSVSPVRPAGTRLRVSIIATGEAAMRAATLDSGRRAGAPGPSWRRLAFAPGARTAKPTDLAAMRGGWIMRRCREQVDAKADELQSAYLSAHPKGRKGVRRPTRASFLARAVYVLATSKAWAIHSLGIVARQFAGKQRAFLGDRLRRHLSFQFRRAGLATRGEM